MHKKNDRRRRKDKRSSNIKRGAKANSNRKRRRSPSLHSLLIFNCCPRYSFLSLSPVFSSILWYKLLLFTIFLARSVSFFITPHSLSLLSLNLLLSFPLSTLILVLALQSVSRSLLALPPHKPSDLETDLNRMLLVSLSTTPRFTRATLPNFVTLCRSTTASGLSVIQCGPLLACLSLACRYVYA